MSCKRHESLTVFLQLVQYSNKEPNITSNAFCLAVPLGGETIDEGAVMLRGFLCHSVPVDFSYTANVYRRIFLSSLNDDSHHS